MGWFPCALSCSDAIVEKARSFCAREGAREEQRTGRDRSSDDQPTKRVSLSGRVPRYLRCTLGACTPAITAVRCSKGSCEELP